MITGIVIAGVGGVTLVIGGILAVRRDEPKGCISFFGILFLLAFLAMVIGSGFSYSQ